MIRDWVRNDLQQLLLRVDGSNGEAMEELDHETSESLEGTWDANGWADFDEDAFGGVDVDLKFACLVDWRVEEGKETLRIVSICCDVGS
jgi:hypothetical protein